MIYYTIISELAAEKFAYLFSNSQAKESIISVSGDGMIDADMLVEAMRGVVKSPEFLSAVCDVKFDSDVADARYARKMTFACMGTPFYNYMSTMCGIPHLDLVGSEEDWIRLHSAVVQLSKFRASEPDEWCGEWHKYYFNNIIY